MHRGVGIGELLENKGLTSSKKRSPQKWDGTASNCLDANTLSIGGQGLDIDADSFEDLEVGILNTVDFLDLGTQVHRNLSRQTDHYGPAWVLTYRQFRNRPIQTLSDSVQRFIADGVDDAGGHLMLRPSMGTLSYRFDAKGRGGRL